MRHSCCLKLVYLTGTMSRPFCQLTGTRGQLEKQRYYRNGPIKGDSRCHWGSIVSGGSSEYFKELFYLERSAAGAMQIVHISPSAFRPSKKSGIAPLSNRYAFPTFDHFPTRILLRIY
ncbi:hypothetical protein EDD16DRAFT_1686340 [Pisolithus croceorrhizus]|nr:hypothetical protein EDD16DRAFT_1686340 [Pisolithus croceorrhizus]